jgi:predicted house-cleaning NTP pyrophosphatase (Maf/HAM1 superfamily)
MIWYVKLTITEQRTEINVLFMNPSEEYVNDYVNNRHDLNKLGNVYIA